MWSIFIKLNNILNHSRQARLSLATQVYINNQADIFPICARRTYEHQVLYQPLGKCFSSIRSGKI